MLLLFAALILGAGLVLDFAAARSAGSTSFASHYWNELSQWWPVLGAGCGKYGMLLLVSVVNSALIVCLVAALRALDSRLNRMRNRRLPALTRARRALARGFKAGASAEAAYILSPVFQ